MSLDIRCEEHLAKTKEFAKKVGKMDNLQQRLDYLANYACPENDPEHTKCELMHDFAPHSFYFNMLVKKKDTGEYVHWFNGGLIWHGPGSSGGSYPTLSVNLGPNDGWSVHT